MGNENNITNELSDLISVALLKEVNQLKELPGVGEIKVKLVGKRDIDINLELTEPSIKVKTLIQLERKIYGNQNLKIKGIKSIKDGLMVLDGNDCTYKIRILLPDN